MAGRITQGRTLRDNEPNALQYYVERERAKKNDPVHKQIQALAVDSGVAALPHVFMVFYLFLTERAESLSRALLMIYGDKLMLTVSLAAFALLFVLKDILGKSLGQHIYKLHIITTDGSEYIQKWKLIVRNLLFFLIPFDVLIIIFTGKRLLDRVLKIDVVPEKKII